MTTAAPTSNTEYEEDVLVAVLLDNNSYDDIALHVEPKDFHRTKNGLHFFAMGLLRARGQEIDFSTVKDLLREQNLLEKAGGPLYLKGLSENGVDTTGGAADKARKIKELACLRLAIADAREKHAGLVEGSVDVDDSEEPQFHLTDTGNAQRFERDHKDTALHCPQNEKWFLYDGQRFRGDEDLKRYDLVDKTIRMIHEDVSKIIGREGRKELSSHAGASESRRGRDAMLHVARHLCRININDFDQDDMLLNVQNGTIDLTTGELRPHSPTDLITKITAAPYVIDAECPLWMNHLEIIFQGNLALIDWFQRVVGYLLTGDASEQCLIFLHGSGLNGKSVVIRTLSGMLQDYAMNTKAQTFTRSKNDKVGNLLAALVGARVVHISEGLRGRALDEDEVKSITGGDMVTARFFYQEYFSFLPKFKILWSTNHLPRIADTTLSIWRRIRLIPFKAVIPPDVRDPHFIKKLEAEWPGILAWAVEGCLRWQEKGLEPAPDEVTVAVEEYRSDQDPISDFLTERTTTGPDMKTGATALYNAYRDYCESVGERSVKQKTFGQLLGERGYEKKKVSSGMVYQNLGLLET